MSATFPVRPSVGPMVYDLRGQQGRYESAPCHPQGCRTFGFWSLVAPKQGDLVVKPTTDGGSRKSLYKITKIDPLPFSGSAGDHYYTGEMVDVVDSYNRLGVNLLTPEDVKAIPA